MHIKLETGNRFFKKTILLKKNKGENIIFGGGDGSGRSECLNMLFREMILGNYIDKSSIYINLLGDQSAFFKNASLLSESNLLNENNLIAFESFTNEGLNGFIENDFKNSALQSLLIDKHVYLAMFALEKVGPKHKSVIYNKIYDLIGNLPINKYKEIPIFIDNISDFEDDDFNKYRELVNLGNKKGYFFVTSTCGMFNLKNFYLNFKILKGLHQHFLIARSHLNLDNKFVKHIAFKKKIDDLCPGEFYYLKNFKLENKLPLRFRFYSPELLDNMPEYIAQKALSFFNFLINEFPSIESFDDVTRIHLDFLKFNFQDFSENKFNFLKINTPLKVTNLL